MKTKLREAKGFLAIAAIPLREWFEPATQVYFATIVQHQINNPKFWHDRVLLIFTERDRDNLDSQLMDHYYAKAFIRLHKLASAQLAFLERDDIFGILNSMSFESRRAIGCYRRWHALLPMTFRRRISLSWLRVRIRELAVALIEYESAKQSVVIFHKLGDKLRVQPVDGPHLQPYLEFFGAVKKLIYDDVRAGERPLIKTRRDFLKYYD